jgi:hypothetical protein
MIAGLTVCVLSMLLRVILVIIPCKFNFNSQSKYWNMEWLSMEGEPSESRPKKHEKKVMKIQLLKYNP